MRSLVGVAVVGCAAVAGAAVLQIVGSDAFGPYYGAIPPVAGTALVALATVASAAFLEVRGWVRVDRPESGRRRFTEPLLLASALVLPVIGVDVAGGFPVDINVLPPEGFLFYPVIALVAETVFRLGPLALLLAGLSVVLPGADRRRLLTACLVVAALPEPVFQVVLGWSSSPPWASAYVGVHLLAFNLVAVWLLRRHGILSTYAFRVCYYGWWHLAWGVLRLRLLF